jgi:hypothetical protein
MKYATEQERIEAKRAANKKKKAKYREKNREVYRAQRRRSENRRRKKRKELGLSRIKGEASKEKDKNRLILWKKENNSLVKEQKRRARELLSNSYVAKLLRRKVSECSEELIEMKRQQLLVARQVKQLNKLLKETENG